LGDTAARVDHVGSTSVPGLAAKPTVDIQVSVPDIADREAYAVPLRRLGYEHTPDPAMPDYPFFGWPAGRLVRTFNLHVCQSGTELERRHLAFRDRLRSDAAARDEYAALKRELAL